jgi:hypothetical protein
MKVSQKVKGLLKKHIYCKYTETKSILLFSLIPLDFNSLVPVFHKFLITSEKIFLVVSLNFAPCQFLEQIVTADETWVHHYELESKTQSMAWEHPWLSNSKVNHQLVRLCLHIFLDMEGVILVHFTPEGESFNRFPYVWPDERSSEEEDFRLMKQSLVWCKTG